MTMDLLCALLMFVGNVGHLAVLSYKVLKFSELEVGRAAAPPLCPSHMPPSHLRGREAGARCASAPELRRGARNTPLFPFLSLLPLC